MYFFPQKQYANFKDEPTLKEKDIQFIPRLEYVFSMSAR